MLQLGPVAKPNLETALTAAPTNAPRREPAKPAATHTAPSCCHNLCLRCKLCFWNLSSPPSPLTSISTNETDRLHHGDCLYSDDHTHPHHPSDRHLHRLYRAQRHRRRQTDIDETAFPLETAQGLQRLAEDWSIRPSQSASLDASAFASTSADPRRQPPPAHPPTPTHPPRATADADADASIPTTADPRAIAPVAAHRQQPRAYHNPHGFVLQPPFRTRAANTLQRPLRRLSAARLWNPTNSTPRVITRKRRLSTPPPPAVPLSHPTLDTTAHPADPIGTGAGDYPLLTLPEQRQIRHSTSTRKSLQVEQAGNETRVSLPKSIRHSHDGKTATPSPVPSQEPIAGPSVPRPEPVVHIPKATGLRKRGQSVTRPRVDVGFVLDKKGKGKAVMAPNEDDTERGPDVLGPPPRHSTASMPDGIGSAVSSNSSIVGDPEGPPDGGEEWGPQHPCFPHLNPHVPVDSQEYANTRIIRIRRDWLLEGDLAPTFSNLYPEILDPAGLSEQEFRRVIEKLNADLIPLFNPYSARNIVDGVLGLVTGWLWEDLGFTGAKSRLAKLEQWIEQWNSDMEKTSSSEEGSVAPKLIPLRRTGYMTLDIQIGDPEIAPAPSTPGASRAGLPIETPVPAAS